MSLKASIGNISLQCKFVKESLFLEYVLTIKYVTERIPWGKYQYSLRMSQKKFQGHIHSFACEYLFLWKYVAESIPWGICWDKYVSTMYVCHRSFPYADRIYLHCKSVKESFKLFKFPMGKCPYSASISQKSSKGKKFPWLVYTM